MAIDFDNDFLELGSSGLGQIFQGGGTFTAWSLTRSYNSGLPRLIDAYGGIGWHGGVADAQKAYWFEHAFSTTDGLWMTPNLSNPLNTWAHIAWTWDTDNFGTDPLFYINGSVVTPTVVTSPTGTPGASSFVIHVGSDGGAYHDGKIDDLKMFRRILSGSEIQEMFHSRGQDGITDSLIRRMCADIRPDGTLVPVTTELSPERASYDKTGNAFFTTGELAAKY